MDDMNVRANEVEEIETGTEIEEVEGSSNAGALLMGIVGGFIAYAIIGGAKKLWAVAEEKYVAMRSRWRPRSPYPRRLRTARSPVRTTRSKQRGSPRGSTCNRVLPLFRL